MGAAQQILLAAKPAAASAYDPDVLAYDTAQQALGGAPLTDTRKALLTTLVTGLKSAGVWALLDRLTMLAGPDQFAARTDLKAPAKSMIASGTLTFTVDLGYQGDGTTGYLNFNEVPSVAGNQFSQNSASIFAYCNLQGAGTTFKTHLGLRTSANIRLDGSATGTATTRLNSSTGIAAVAQGTRTGFRATTRTAATALQYWFNPTTTTPYITGTNASSTVPAESIVTHRSQSVLYDDRLSAVGYGAALSGQNVLDLYNALTTYLTAIGGA